MVKDIVIRQRQGNSKRYPPAETDLECGQGCTGGFERVASGVGRDQNERQNDWERTHVGR